MGIFNTPSLIIILVIVLLLFGRGKIPGLMSDIAKGIKSFKKDIGKDDINSDTQKDSKDTNKED